MHAMQNMPISFPGLFGGLSFNPDPKALDIGNGIYWYGIMICLGVILAILFCSKQAAKYGIKEDDVYEMMIWALPMSVIGARLYYVVFYLDLYRNPDGSFNWSDAIAIWDGGIAIYGAIIAAAITLIIFSKAKKLSIGAMMDLGSMGLFIGQFIGRWGNFFNREAFGETTTLPWRMGLWMDASTYVEVHPTFLYESLWNFVGFLLLWLVISRLRSFDGENACFYLAWYAFGRFWIEGLRTDSLYLFDWTIAGEPVRVSQALSVVIFVVAVAVLLIKRSKHPSPDDLFVTRRLMAESAEQSEKFVAENGELEDVLVEEDQTIGEETAEDSEEEND